MDLHAKGAKKNTVRGRQWSSHPPLLLPPLYTSRHHPPLSTPLPASFRHHPSSEEKRTHPYPGLAFRVCRLFQGGTSPPVLPNPVASSLRPLQRPSAPATIRPLSKPVGAAGLNALRRRPAFTLHARCCCSWWVSPHCIASAAFISSVGK
jgi:hypothetical protein